MKKVFAYILGLMAFMFMALGLYLLGRTKVDAVVPVCAAFVGACALWPLSRAVWRWLAPSFNRWLRLLVHILVAGSFVFGGLLALNYYVPASPSEGGDDMEVTGIVVRKYSQERTRYRHVGRRNIPSGKTWSYYADIMLPDSTVVKWPVSVGEYTRIRVGQKRKVSEHRGILGYEVVRL